MRRHSTRHLDRAALTSIIGTSLMAVVASSAGYDDLQVAPVAPVAQVAAARRQPLAA